MDTVRSPNYAVNEVAYLGGECAFIFQKLWRCKKDTGLNVGTNNVPRHVKINADEFPLKKKRKCFTFQFISMINNQTDDTDDRTLWR